MQVNPLDYPRLVQDALRGVVRRSLSYVQSHGLPGEHHFYLAFATTAPGVSLSEDLRRRYPEQITIVLQHDFRDLDVDDEFFAVTLRFGGIPQRIRVPFAAMVSFYDPASQFALRFEPELDDETDIAPAHEDTSSRAAVRAVLAAADRLAAAKEAALQELKETEQDQDPAIPSELPERPRRHTLKPRPAPQKAEKGNTDDATADGPDQPEEEPASDNVVSIDSFRRK